MTKEKTPHWLGMEAPRYTSYPTAHHFSSHVGTDDYREWLTDLDENSTISAYAHVPFCKELCWFCGCHTKMTKRYEPIEKYVRTLLKEIETLKHTLQGRGTLVNLHFGGGSPSLLEEKDLMAIMYAITSCYGRERKGEFAIELDPRTAPKQKIQMYADMGFNRVSIGLQDFNPEVQQAINRIQSFELVRGVMDDLRSAGLEHINCDLIYGLPHQSKERFEDSIKKTIALSPERIALFSYAHVPQIKKHQRLIDTAWLPPEMEKLGLYIMACEMLTAAGYVQVGIDHYAKPTDPLAIAMQNRTMRRNFQGYVTDTTDAIIAVGNSSISQLPQGYVQNSANMPDYNQMVEAGQLPVVRGRRFTAEDIIRKQIIDELMCFMSVDLAAIRAQHQLPAGYFTNSLKALEAPAFVDILQIENEQIQLTTPYRMAARVVAAAFDQYHGVAAGRYSKVA